MAFLKSIAKRVDLKMKGVKAESDERDPTTVKDIPWISELDPKRFTELASGGKWMLFYPKTQITAIWRKCQTLYRNNQLKGVSNMKVSTSNDYHTSPIGVIILYCGPPDDEAKCIQIGKIILAETGYTNASGTMLYKTDKQTLSAKSIGAHKYKLEIPKKNFDKLNSNAPQRPKIANNLLAQIKKKKKKKKAISTTVRTRDGKIFTETINANGTVTKKVIATEAVPRYLEENKSPTRPLPSYVFGKNNKWNAIRHSNDNADEHSIKNEDEKKENEVKELVIMSYNVWFADRKWRGREEKLLSMVKEMNPDIFCFQEVTQRFLKVLCENEFIIDNYELSDNAVGNSVFPYGVFIGCNRKKNGLRMRQLLKTELPGNMRRALLSAEINMNGKSVWINTAHLESLLNTDWRIEQLKLIFGDYMKQQIDSLFMGDFNFGDYTVENQHLSKEYVDCWKMFVQNKMNDENGGNDHDLKDDGLDKYRRMNQNGVPKGAIMQKMKQDGVDVEIIVGYEKSGTLPEGGMYLKMKEQRGDTMGCQRFDRMLLKSEKWNVSNFEVIGKPNMPSDHLGIVANIKMV